jgi:hypothetical protein
LQVLGSGRVLGVVALIAFLGTLPRIASMVLSMGIYELRSCVVLVIVGLFQNLVSFAPVCCCIIQELFQLLLHIILFFDITTLADIE